ncbi:MAG: hypothetical protein PQJ47_05290, partial [Sphaerochaetaceae bacterium]|nr:hypothetical protein [Sphaerochaetaceae bacterium]
MNEGLDSQDIAKLLLLCDKSIGLIYHQCSAVPAQQRGKHLCISFRVERVHDNLIGIAGTNLNHFIV